MNMLDVVERLPGSGGRFQNRQVPTIIGPKKLFCVREWAMDLIFHIGTEKAGSTSIQSWLDDNSEKLRQDGIFYCRSFLRPNNLGVYLYGLGGGFDDGFAYLGAISDEEKSKAVEKFRQDFLEEVAGAKLSGARMFVISNEHCHSRLKTPATIRRVHDLLAPLFDNITIWCFLRPQVDVCVSLASTLAAGGIKITKDLFRSLMQENEYYFNYNKILSHWADAFGKDNIKPIPFKSNTNTVQYFLDSLSLDANRFFPAKAAQHRAGLSRHRALDRNGDGVLSPKWSRKPKFRVFYW